MTGDGDGAVAVGREWDVVVVGGGPAGMTAALYLGRSRRRVLVVDEGEPRHAVSAGVHNFLTREGVAPAELRRIAWEQLAVYPGVERLAGRVADLRWMGHDGAGPHEAPLEGSGPRWEVTVDGGDTLRARAVVLATGVVDEHPEIVGYGERWGTSIHHCPFCHGYESRDLPLAVLVDPAMGFHLPLMLRGWTDDVVVLTNGRACDDEQRRELARGGLMVHEAPVVELRGPGAKLEEIVLGDGTTLRRQGLFVAGSQRMPELVQRVGPALTEQGYVAVDMMQKTNLPMLWAAGDLTSRYQQVVEASAQGARAGAMIQATFVMAG